MTSGSVWVSGDIISATRMNQKTVLVDIGSALNSATKAAGMLMYCTSTGSGYIVDHLYQVQSDGVTIVDRSTISSDILVYPYSTTIGDYSVPSAITATSYSTTTIGGQTSQSLFSGIFGQTLVCKMTGLTSGKHIISAGFDITGATGNIRVKIYQDDGAGGLPSTLLGESGSLPAVTGFTDYAVTATVPASGNIWVGLEVDTSSGTAKIYYSTGAAGTGDQIAHTYGTGPSPFGSGSTGTFNYHSRVNYYATVTNPHIYGDYGSSVEIAAIAFYIDKSLTTETQIKLRTSPDASTWTDKRLINVSDLVTGWNYYRWNRDIAQNRYAEIYGNSGSSVVLAVSLIEFLVPTALQWSARHGHKLLDPTDTTFPATA